MNDPTCACGCCAGVAASTPRPVDNRLGLPVIGYRVGTHADLRASLLTALSAAHRPALAQLRTRDPRDLTIALLDAMATMCDVLTFYTERLAQESYLRTAVDRTSLQELGRLVAYRLKPGVAAQTHLAFFIEPPPATPAPTGNPTEAFAPAPYLTSVELPAGLPVRSVPGPGEQPQTFETAELVSARPQWNAWRAKRTRPTVLGSGAATTTASFVGTGLNLRVGDMLLFAPASAPASDWATRSISTVQIKADEGVTTVTWSPALSTSELPSSPVVHVLRKRLSIFGHNAPLHGLITAATGDEEDDWDNMQISPVCGAADIDGSHPEMLVDTWLVLTAPSVTNRALFQVSSVSEVSRTAFAISGKATRVMLNGAFEEYLEYRYDKVREILVYGASEKLTLAPAADTSTVDGGDFTVDAAVLDLPVGRTLLVAGLRADTSEAHLEAVTLAGVAAEDGGGTNLTLAADLTQDLQRSSVVVYGNVARATHGETVHQILGGGDASRSYQSFELQHAPLTYVPSADASGATSSLEVRVNDVEWHEVPSLYPAEPGDRSFVTRDTEQGTVVVAFGDGQRAARLPTGQNNVRAVYRKGIGAAGNVRPGAISQVMDPPLGLTRVTNPTPATGGADPETAAAARDAIPVAVRTLGRAVSLLDYADYARAFAGIAKAHATVLNLAGGRTIVVTVAAADGTPVPPDACERLTTSLRSHGDPLVSVVVLPHRAPTFRLAAKVKRDPDYLADLVLAAVADEVTRSFGFAARDFVAPVHRSEVVAAVHRVPGVLAVDVDRLYRVAPPSPAEPGWPPFTWLATRLLAAAPRADASGAALAAELLTVAEDPFDWLVELESSP